MRFRAAMTSAGECAVISLFLLAAMAALPENVAAVTADCRRTATAAYCSCSVGKTGATADGQAALDLMGSTYRAKPNSAEGIAAFRAAAARHGLSEAQASALVSRTLGAGLEIDRACGGDDPAGH